MKTIGFTNVYYTLWEVYEPVQVPVYHNAVEIGYNMQQTVVYCQNLSMDFERAKEKVAAMGDGKYEIDLELRGHSTFTRVVGSNIKDREEYYPEDCFSFGRMEGGRIIDATDIWQLKRAYYQEKSARRRVWARRRLIQLEELKRYTFINAEGVKRNWAEPRVIAAEEMRKKSGHFFTNGEKVTLEVKEIDSFSFDGMYGRTYIIVYLTKCDKIVKYMGSSPKALEHPYEIELNKKMRALESRSYTARSLAHSTPDTEKEKIEELLKESDELNAQYDVLEAELAAFKRPEWIKIQATVKHGDYKGAETKLQRIKMVK